MNRITILFILLLFSLFLFYKPKKRKHRSSNCICIRDNFKIIDSTYLSPSQEFLKIVPKILYINLENRKDRNKEFLSNFPDYDPNTNSIERIDAIYDSQNGNIGCLKSHIKALKYAMTLNTPYVLFAEDDLYIKDMNYAVNSLKKVFENFQNWDVLMLSINLISSEPTPVDGIIRVKSAQTASGYFVKKSYISKILSIYERDLNEYNKSQKWSDWYCTDQSWKELQKVDLWYSFNPIIAIQRKSYSDIQKGVVDYGI
jgi:GR25 family glycosyltransferase involved in LPS biosynthesis